jgi:hypothetical protein
MAVIVINIDGIEEPSAGSTDEKEEDYREKHPTIYDFPNLQIVPVEPSKERSNIIPPFILPEIPSPKPEQDGNNELWN